MPRCRTEHDYEPWKPCRWGHSDGKEKKYAPLTNIEFKQRLKACKDGVVSPLIGCTHIVWFRKCRRCGKEDIKFGRADEPKPKDDWQTKVRKRQRQKGVPERGPVYGRRLKTKKETSTAKEYYRG